MTRPRAVALIALPAALGLTLAGCGSSTTGSNATSVPMSSMSSSMTGGSGSPTTTAPAEPSSRGATSSSQPSFNDNDVNFAADMISHHQQAVTMAKLAASHTKNAKVLKLARAIEAAQGPEITTMSGWLTSWGKPLPEDMSGMDMGSSMPGMMSMAQMAKLGKAKDAAFDKQFLTMMIAHHEGAVTMARAEIKNGSYAAEISLCKLIITAQTTEITTMKAMLKA